MLCKRGANGERLLLVYVPQVTRQGRSQDFSKEGRGGHTVSNIVMAFSPQNVVGCLLKKGLQRGVTGTPGPPLAMPW